MKRCPACVIMHCRTRRLRGLWAAMGNWIHDGAHAAGDRGPAGAQGAEFLVVNPTAACLHRRRWLLGRVVAGDHGHLATRSIRVRADPATIEGEAKTWTGPAGHQVDPGVDILSLHAIRLLPRIATLPSSPKRSTSSISGRSKARLRGLRSSSYLVGDDFTVADLNVAAVIKSAIQMDLRHAAPRRVAQALPRTRPRSGVPAAEASTMRRRRIPSRSLL